MTEDASSLLCLCFQSMAGPAVSQSHRDPSPAGPMLVLMLCSPSLKILDFSTWVLHFHFAPVPADYVANSACSDKSKVSFSLVLFSFLWDWLFKYIVQSLARSIPVCLWPPSTLQPCGKFIRSCLMTGPAWSLKLCPGEGSFLPLVHTSVSWPTLGPSAKGRFAFLMPTSQKLQHFPNW